MSALQESRRELMVQLEGLMRLLKVKAVDRFGRKSEHNAKALSCGQETAAPLPLGSPSISFKR